MIHQFELYIFRLIQAYGWQKAKLCHSESFWLICLQNYLQKKRINTTTTNQATQTGVIKWESRLVNKS